MSTIQYMNMNLDVPDVPFLVRKQNEVMADLMSECTHWYPC